MNLNQTVNALINNQDVQLKIFAKTEDEIILGLLELTEKKLFTPIDSILTISMSYPINETTIRAGMTLNIIEVYEGNYRLAYFLNEFIVVSVAKETSFSSVRWIYKYLREFSL